MKSDKVKYYVNRYSFLANMKGDIAGERSLHNFDDSFPNEIKLLMKDVVYDYPNCIIHPDMK